MSYWNKLHLQYADPDARIDIAEIEDDLKHHLTEQGIHVDVVGDLVRLFSTGAADFKLYTVMADDLLLWISMQRPAVEFGVQGCGEDLRDIWVREYADGEVSYAQGPFD